MKVSVLYLEQTVEKLQASYRPALHQDQEKTQSLQHLWRNPSFCFGGSGGGFCLLFLPWFALPI